MPASPVPACALCGTPAPPPFRAPPAELAPDLDGRPGEPARSTLPRWVLACRSCGACAPDLTALPAAAAALTGSSEYRALRPRALRWAALVAGAPAEAEALLHAAWAADDRGEDAAPLRRRAAAAWPEPVDAEGTLRLVDVLRRAGMFAEATARLHALADAPDDSIQRIAAFQGARIAAGDMGRHMISSALRPPARTPHVTHGRREPGFWGRLFGRAAR